MCLSSWMVNGQYCNASVPENICIVRLTTRYTKKKHTYIHGLWARPASSIDRNNNSQPQVKQKICIRFWLLAAVIGSVSLHQRVCMYAFGPSAAIIFHVFSLTRDSWYHGDLIQNDCKCLRVMSGNEWWLKSKLPTVVFIIMISSCIYMIDRQRVYTIIIQCYHINCVTKCMSSFRLSAKYQNWKCIISNCVHIIIETSYECKSHYGLSIHVRKEQ